MSPVETICENIRNDLMTSINYTGFEFNLIFDGNLNKIMEYLQIFENYLQGIIKILTNCQEIGQHFREYFKTDATFAENILNLMKNLTKITNSSNVSMRANLCSTKTQFTRTFFSVIFHLYDPNYFLEIMNEKQINEERKTLYDRCVITNLIEAIVIMPVSD